MSIAVRVSVGILGLCVVVSAVFAVMTYVQKQTLQTQNQGLHNQIIDDQTKLADLTTKAKKLEDDADDLNKKVSQTQQEKAQVQSQFDDLKHKSDDLQSQLNQANSDRNDWKNRADTISHERDNLLQKLKNPPVKIIYKDRIVVKTEAAPGSDEENPLPSVPGIQVASGQGDQYWASILKQKAALQLELQKEKSDLDQAAMQVVDLKKQNSDLELQVKQVSNEKDEIIQRIKYGQDLADNLAIDLARSRNDQKAVNDRADKLKEENLELLSQIRVLTSSKLGLEKTISRLTDEKDAMQRKLIETESVIQSRIDDIWKIKESLDKRLSSNIAANIASESSLTPSAGSSPGSGSMELPPIIVNTPNNNQQQATLPPSNPPTNNPPPQAVGKTEGSIISINDINNFVIIDLGQGNSSVSVGNIFKAYRNSQEIATLEVIQVRREICAADIKEKTSDLQVGDVVRISNP